MKIPRGLKPGYNFWTPEDDAYLVEVYATKTPLEEIVAHIGHPMNSIYKRAMFLGVRRPKNYERGRKQLGQHSQRALVLGARPDGVNAAEMGGNYDSAAKAFAYLVKTGMLFRGALGRRTVRYFTTQVAADRYVATNIAAHMAKQAPHIAKHSPAVRWDKDAPMVITPNTKFTYAPPPPAVVFRTNTFSR